MHNELISDNLKNVIESIDLIEHRFVDISKADDFVSNNEGIQLLDSICMRLQIIGELLKKIDKIDDSLFSNHPDIEWHKIMKLRDIISHHYEDIDHELIYDICRNHIPQLKVTAKKIHSSFSS